jgi:beta-fructofuranosidase
MILAGKHFGDLGGSVYLYTSPDLETWNFSGTIFKHDAKGIECPNMLKFGEHYVLIISPYSQVQYAVGRLDYGKFLSEQWFALDHGKEFYATNTFIDGEKGYKLIGWLKVPGNGAWHGCLSLPRHIALADNGLRIVPADGLQSLRKGSIDWSTFVEGNYIEIKATFPMNGKSIVGLLLQDDEWEYPVTVDRATGEIHVLNETHKLEHFIPSEPLNLHIFIDYSVVEVFVNERGCLSTWLRPALSGKGTWRVQPR